MDNVNISNIILYRIGKIYTVKQMKRSTILLFGFLMLMLFHACTGKSKKQVQTNSKEQHQLPKYLTNTTISNLALPDGTSVKQIDNATVKFTYPQGIKLWLAMNTMYL